MISSERLAALQMKIPPILLGHRAYAASLVTIAECMERLTKSEGASTGVSPARMANMLRATLFHAHDGCAECAAQRKESLLPVERRVLRAYYGERGIAGYKNSTHDKCASSLARVVIEDELLPLPALLERLTEKSAPKSSRVAAVEIVQQLTA
jgi:hypothetical protein